ncbi:hypothetical protein JNUCC0626_17395 [Lentzea sp. JNUCC 0626]|uniref:hypothetical protein n=1 Tax=Lentzea sp. JNUCC 0626 TaxID=3367513 RepID=UPI003749D3F0
MAQEEDEFSVSFEPDSETITVESRLLLLRFAATVGPRDRVSLVGTPPGSEIPAARSR